VVSVPRTWDRLGSVLGLAPGGQAARTGPYENSQRQATFTEQVDGLTFRHGRRSTGLQTVLERLAVMLAGRAGARLSQTLTSGVSRSTLLRLIRQSGNHRPW
jgi:hypothetical protein